MSKVVQQWIKYARTDLKIAKACLEQSSEFKNAAAFHAQQCSEKIVKAYLTFKGIRVAKTHDMTILISEVAKVDSKLASRIKKSKSLTSMLATQ